MTKFSSDLLKKIRGLKKFWCLFNEKFWSSGFLSPLLLWYQCHYFKTVKGDIPQNSLNIFILGWNNKPFMSFLGPDTVSSIQRDTRHSTNHLNPSLKDVCILNNLNNSEQKICGITYHYKRRWSEKVSHGKTGKKKFFLKRFPSVWI